jgi:hypothetical protein
LIPRYKKINQNKRLKEGLLKLYNYGAHKFSEYLEEIGNVNLLNEQFQLIRRGVDESQHSFNILIGAFVLVEQRTLQPRLITSEKIQNILRTQRLPDGLGCSNFPFPQLHEIITPNTYAYKWHLVYILEIFLFSPTVYHLYKLLTFAPTVQQEEFACSYCGFNKSSYLTTH